MMHQGVKTVKERVMGVGFCVLMSLGTASLHAMGDENLTNSEIESAQPQTTGGFADWLKGWFDVPENNQAPKPQVDAVSAVPAELPEAAQTSPVEVQKKDEIAAQPVVDQSSNNNVIVQFEKDPIKIEDEPRIVRTEQKIVNTNVIESIQVQDNMNVAIESTEKQSLSITKVSSEIPAGNGSEKPVVSEGFWKNITFQGLAQNEKVMYGIGAVGVLTIGTVCYVLYKKGVFKKLCVSMKNHPWCTAAITGVAAVSAAAGALYLSGADKESVMNFFDGIKAQVQKVPGAIKNSLPTFGKQEKAA